MTLKIVGDHGLDRLTDEQLIAAGTRSTKVFIEAAPGSGKTTVAAQRFGVCRYSWPRVASGAFDPRAVIAVSFTRSATRELRERVRKTWGPSGLAWPHRIVTLDSLIYELLQYLLASGLVLWPGGHLSLEVHDTWKVLVDHEWTRTVTQVYLFSGGVQVRATYDEFSMRPVFQAFAEAVATGVCTHEDVRRVLDFALKSTDVVSALQLHLAETTRALIVDEVFDANELDIRVMELALAAGVEVTLIGDPWQALYGFRGARPDLVAALLSSADVGTFNLRSRFDGVPQNRRSLLTIYGSCCPSSWLRFRRAKYQQRESMLSWRRCGATSGPLGRVYFRSHGVRRRETLSKPRRRSY
jgi:DNA helicase II / ATP-dependent DNA helicase PcrA